MKSLKEGVRLHSYIIKTRPPQTIFISNHLIQIYSHNNLLDEACQLFQQMPEKNIVSWNTMIHANIRNKNLTQARFLFDSAPIKDSVTYNSIISGYARDSLSSSFSSCSDYNKEEALNLFCEMQVKGIKMDEFTFTTMLNLIADLSVLSYGKQIHSCMVKTANDSNGFTGSSLIDMYSKCGSFDDALHVFDKMPDRDLVSKNAMVAACCREGKLELAFDLFHRVPAENDTVSWNTLVSGFAQNGNAKMALELFVRMAKNGTRQNEHTFTSVLSVCANMESPKQGKEIHGVVLKNGMSSNQYISSGLVDFYCKCGNLEYAKIVHAAIWPENVFSSTSMIMGYARRGEMREARRLFDMLSGKNVIAWTALFSGYIRYQQCNAVFDLFQEFQRREAGIPDTLIIISVIAACALQAALNHGKQIHGYTVRVGIQMNEKLGSALIDMYAKCGEINYARKIFRRVSSRDRVLYNAMMAGFAHHGQEDNAIKLFKEMAEETIEPDEVTFIALLSACRHAGLVETGDKYFDSMIKDHGMSPEMEHYACMVDLYARAHRFDKVVSLMEQIPIEPDAIIWGAFLNACKINGNTELAREAEEKLLRMECKNGARYVQLANVYAAEGEWGEMRRIRRKMRGREVKKIAGCSWVHMENSVNIFTSGDRYHSKAEEIYAMLTILNEEMKEEESLNLILGDY